VVLPQVVPLEYSLHALAVPLHTPFCLQEFGPSSRHSFCGSLSPVMKPQLPSAPMPFNAAVHASQIPAQGALQHTPSVQNVL
jgi:hypothetical protein